MANGNRPAIHIQAVIGDFQKITAVHHLAGKRFVDLPQVDVGHGQAKAFEQFGNRKHRANAHFFRCTTTHCYPAIGAQRFDAALPGFGTAHQQHGRGTIGKLRGVARCDELALLHPLAVFPDRFKGRQILKGG